MGIFLNIANKPEVARRADNVVRGLLATLRSTAIPEMRSSIILRSVQSWRALFPRYANSEAVAAFTRALNIESGRGNGGVEVIECIRCLDSLASNTRSL